MGGVCHRYVAEKLAFGPYKTRQAFETARDRLDDLVPGIEWVGDLDGGFLVVRSRLKRKVDRDDSLQKPPNERLR